MRETRVETSLARRPRPPRGCASAGGPSDRARPGAPAPPARTRSGPGRPVSSETVAVLRSPSVTPASDVLFPGIAHGSPVTAPACDARRGISGSRTGLQGSGRALKGGGRMMRRVVTGVAVVGAVSFAPGTHALAQ